MFKKNFVVALIFLSFVVMACYRPNGSACAAEKVVDPHLAKIKYYFQDGEMDYVFGPMFLGAAINGGAEVGEAYITATKIRDGDPASWQEEWIKIAGIVEARGERSLALGHKVSARSQFLRASYYYRESLISMLPNDPRYMKTALKSRELLKKAGKFFDPPLEYIEIPFEGTVLHGYFRKAAAGNAPRKTILMLGGAETFIEDLYFYNAPQCFEHGYNFMTVDLPGQGLLPAAGKYFRPAMYHSVRAAVDYALSRPDVDPARLALYGYSTGGFIAPQAAQHDPRIKAVIACHSVVDGYAEVCKMPPMTPESVKNWPLFKLGCYKSMAWRFGLGQDDIAGIPAKNKGFVHDPTKISVPALIIVAADEGKNPEIQRQTRISFDNLPNPKKRLVITPGEEGASAHCVMDNRSLANQEIFDWLDEVFE